MLYPARQFGLSRLSHKCCKSQSPDINDSSLGGGNENHSHAKGGSQSGDKEFSGQPDAITSGQISKCGVGPSISIPSSAWSNRYKTFDKQEKLEVGIDSLRFSLVLNSDQWRELIWAIYQVREKEFWVNNDTLRRSFKGDKGYNRACIGEDGSTLNFRIEETEDGDKRYCCQLVMMGTALEGMGALQVMRMLLTISTFQTCYPTRLDFAVDDHIGFLEPSAIVTALSEGNYAGFKTKHVDLSDSTGNGWDGFTANCGSRESDNYWRIYQTGVKHDFDAMRLERECKGDTVKLIWENRIKPFLHSNWETIWHKGFSPKVTKLLEEWADMMGALAVSGIDFIDRSNQYSNGSLETCPRLDWWQKLRDYFGTITIKKPVKKATLQSKCDWLNKQVSGTLKFLHEGFGEQRFFNFIKGMISEKTPTPEHEMFIATILRDGYAAMLGFKADDHEGDAITLTDEQLQLVPF